MTTGNGYVDKYCEWINAVGLPRAKENIPDFGMYLWKVRELTETAIDGYVAHICDYYGWEYPEVYRAWKDRYMARNRESAAGTSLIGGQAYPAAMEYFRSGGCVFRAADVDHFYIRWANHRNMAKDNKTVIQIYMRHLYTNGLSASRCMKVMQVLSERYKRPGDEEAEQEDSFHEWRKTYTYKLNQPEPTEHNQEEIEMALTNKYNVHDRKFYNGTDLTTQSDDQLLVHISSLDQQIKELEEFAARTESAKIAAQLEEAKAARKALVAYLDAR